MCLNQLLPELIGSHYEVFIAAVLLVAKAPSLINVLRDLVRAKCVRRCTTRGMRRVFAREVLGCKGDPIKFEKSIRAYLRQLRLPKKKKVGKPPPKKK